LHSDSLQRAHAFFLGTPGANTSLKTLKQSQQREMPINARHQQLGVTECLMSEGLVPGTLLFFVRLYMIALHSVGRDYSSPQETSQGESGGRNENWCCSPPDITYTHVNLFRHTRPPIELILLRMSCTSVQTDT
jgi:hypothetical protein